MAVRRGKPGNRLHVHVRGNAFTPRRWRIIPDDRLTSLTINGLRVPLDRVPAEGLTDWEHGFEIDLSGWLHGDDELTFTLDNRGGPGGLTLRPVVGWRSALLALGMLPWLLAMAQIVRLRRPPHCCALRRTRRDLRVLECDAFGTSGATTSRPGGRPATSTTSRTSPKRGGYRVRTKAGSTTSPRSTMKAAHSRGAGQARCPSRRTRRSGPTRLPCGSCSSPRRRRRSIALGAGCLYEAYAYPVESVDAVTTSM